MPVVSFHNISVKVPAVAGLKRHLPSCLQGRNAPSKTILHNVSGTFPRKGLVAVMGPSGSSKTTLLNTISNRMSLAGSAGLEAYGEVHVDGINVPPDFFFSKKVSFVPQDTCLFAELTPRESIRYATHFTYPHWDDKQITAQVDSIIAALNIGKCADSLIGNDIFRGISGGEAKRTSIGVNIVNQPEILILDEPTTGLDSETATLCVRSILNLSTPSLVTDDSIPEADKDGRLIIMTLHQPSSEIWEMIDHVVLLAEGHIVYNGPTKEAVPYFASLGYRLPPNTNPADFLLDVVQMAEDPPEIPKIAKRPSSSKSRSSRTNESTTGSQVLLDANTGNRSSKTSMTNLDRIKQMSLSAIGTIGGKEAIVTAPRHANKYERARYLAHAWKNYEQEIAVSGGHSLPGGFQPAFASASGPGHSSSSFVVEDAATVEKRERLRQMMVKYHREQGHNYRLAGSGGPAAKTQSLYDPDESNDTFNYEDATNPLRYRSSATGDQHGRGRGGGGSSGPDVETSNNNNNNSTSPSPHDHGLSILQVFFKQLGTLTSRSWTTFIRQKLTLPMKFGQIVLSALIVMALYCRFEHNQQSVISRSSCMYLLIIIQIFATVLSVALTFPNERGVYVNEQASRLYMVAPYFASKLIIDIPILTLTIVLFSVLTYFPIGLTPGFDRFLIYNIILEAVACIGHGLGLIVACLVPSPAMAVLLAPMTIAPFILFSHIAIPSGNILPFLKPVMWLSPFYWGLDALMINEFRGIKLGCTDKELFAVPSVQSGLLYLCRFENAKDALDSYSIKSHMLWPCIIILYVIAGALILLSGISLQIISMRISKAVKLKPAPLV